MPHALGHCSIRTNAEFGPAAIRIFFAVREHKDALEDRNVFVRWVPMRWNFFTVWRLQTQNERKSWLARVSFHHGDLCVQWRQVRRRLALNGIRGGRTPV